MDEQLAKERAEEMAKTKEKELSLKEKKSKSSGESGVKVYSKGIGKFINPKLKKEAKRSKIVESANFHQEISNFF